MPFNITGVDVLCRVVIFQNTQYIIWVSKYDRSTNFLNFSLLVSGFIDHGIEKIVWYLYVLGDVVILPIIEIAVNFLGKALFDNARIHIIVVGLKQQFVC